MSTSSDQDQIAKSEIVPDAFNHRLAECAINNHQDRAAVDRHQDLFVGAHPMADQRLQELAEDKWQQQLGEDLQHRVERNAAMASRLKEAGRTEAA